MTKKHFTEKEKAQIALLAVKGEKTINQLASAYKVHPNQVLGWKRQLLSNLPFLFLIIIERYFPEELDV